VKPKKDLTYDTVPSEIRRAKFPKTSQKLYLRDYIEADFNEAEWEKYGLELCGSEKWFRIKGKDLIDYVRDDKICATWRSSAG
jgi:hypothetical protein